MFRFAGGSMVYPLTVYVSLISYLVRVVDVVVSVVNGGGKCFVFI